MKNCTVYEVPLLCPICKLELKNYLKGNRSGKYKGDIFKIHLEKEHNLTLFDFFKNNKILKECSCGCKKLQNSFKVGKDINIGHYRKVGSSGKTHQPVWNKGLDKESDVRIKKQAVQMVGELNPRFGKKPWNYGLSKNENAKLLKISENRKGIAFSKEHKKKISKALKGNTNHLNKKHNEHTKTKIRKKTLEQIKEQSLNCSQIEQDFKTFLENENINFEYQYICGDYVYDFLIEVDDKKIIVAVNGDYYHGNPNFRKTTPLTMTQVNNIKRDYKRYKNIKCNQNIYGIIIMWENEICNKKKMARIFKYRLQKLLKSNKSVIGKLMTWKCLKKGGIM
jgi:hypothetical protein